MYFPMLFDILNIDGKEILILLKFTLYYFHLLPSPFLFNRFNFTLHSLMLFSTRATFVLKFTFFGMLDLILSCLFCIKLIQFWFNPFGHLSLLMTSCVCWKRTYKIRHSNQIWFNRLTTTKTHKNKRIISHTLCKFGADVNAMLSSVDCSILATISHWKGLKWESAKLVTVRLNLPIKKELYLSKYIRLCLNAINKVKNSYSLLGLKEKIAKNGYL